MGMDKDILGAALKAGRDDVFSTYMVDTMTPEQANDYRLAMAVADAEAIIDHIKQYATIEPLSTSSTPAGQGPHTHNPHTVQTTGKIK